LLKLSKVLVKFALQNVIVNSVTRIPATASNLNLKNSNKQMPCKASKPAKSAKYLLRQSIPKQSNFVFEIAVSQERKKLAGAKSVNSW